MSISMIMRVKSEMLIEIIQILDNSLTSTNNYGCKQ